MKDQEKVKMLFTEAIGHKTTFLETTDPQRTDYLKGKAENLMTYLNANSFNVEKAFVMAIKNNEYHTVEFKINHEQLGSIFPQLSMPRDKYYNSPLNEKFTRIWTKGPNHKFVWATCSDFFKSNANPKLLFYYFQQRFEQLETEYKSIIHLNITHNILSRSDEYDNFPFPLPFAKL